MADVPARGCPPVFPVRSLAAASRREQPGSRLAQASWVIHEWACQPFYSLVVIFLFAPYFTGHLAADPVTGQALWGYANAIGGLMVALLGPLLGAVADAAGPRKPWIMGCALVAAAACALLWWAVPGAPLLPLLAAVAAALVGIECLFVFANAMLPSVAPAGRIGLLSGLGIAAGQSAGLFALLLVLLATAQARFDGSAVPLPPDLDPAGLAGAGRMVGPFSALWLVAFILPLLLFVPDRAAHGPDRGQSIRAALRRLSGSVSAARRAAGVPRFLAARVVFYSGMSIVFLFAGVLAESLYSWETRELVLFGLLTTCAAVLGAAACGLADGRLGTRRTLLAALTLAAVSFLVMLCCPGAGPDSAAAAGLLVFLAASSTFGLAAGAVLSASRALFAQIVPPGRTTEFFGIYALSAQVASFAGPALVGLATLASGSQRTGLLVAVPLIASGALLLAGVRHGAARKEMTGSLSAPVHHGSLNPGDDRGGSGRS
jgi:UMF1 family MFS transporter